MLKFQKRDAFPEEYVLVLAIKENWYTLYFFETGITDAYGCDWIDFGTFIELVE